MKYKLFKNHGQMIPSEAKVKPWRQSPGNLSLACRAAFYYAKKWNEDVAIVPGNSYMNLVYHVCSIKNSVRKYAIMSSVDGFVVTPEGVCWSARLSDKEIS